MLSGQVRLDLPPAYDVHQPVACGRIQDQLLLQFLRPGLSNNSGILVPYNFRCNEVLVEEFTGYTRLDL